MKRELLINFCSGKELRVSVSNTTTVTFGGLIPGAKVDGGSNRTALRVYEGKRQLAVFTQVESFRFTGEVSVLEKRVQNASKNVSFEENGVTKQRTVNVSTEEWVNPDETRQPPDATKLLSSISLEAS